MSQQNPNSNPTIIIHNTNSINSQQSNDPNKQENGKSKIWVAIIGLIGVLGVPLIAYFLSTEKELNKYTPISSECSSLKKQLGQQNDELMRIEVMLKDRPDDLKLQADKITHVNNIKSLNDKLISEKCD